METVLKWYRLLYKDKLNHTFYYLLGLVDYAPAHDMTEFAKKLELSESARKKLVNEVDKTRRVMAKFGPGVRSMKKSEIFHELGQLGLESQLFLMAKTASDETKKIISNYITYADSFRPLLAGKHLQQMGIKEGPIFREILDALKDAKIDRSLATREQEMEFVRTYMQERGIEQ